VGWGRLAPPAPLHRQHLGCSDLSHSVAHQRNYFKACRASAACCRRQSKTTEELLPGEGRKSDPSGGERNTQEEKGDSSVPWLPRKPKESWGASRRVWPAGQGRFFFPSTLP